MENQYIVEKGGMRIDLWLSLNIENLSRRRAISALLEKKVLLNGRPVKKSTFVQPGQVIELLFEPDEKKFTPVSTFSEELTLFHEESEFALVLKPSGIPSIALKKGGKPSLADMIAQKLPQCAQIGNWGDAGLVQRLDTETSGLMIVAKTKEAHSYFKDIQKKEMIKKGYLALVWGTGEIPSIIEEPLYSNPKKAPTVKVHKSGQNRITQVEVLARAEKYCLLKAFITKGFRHQIRVHLAHCGFPLCGDKKYGGIEFSVLNRLFLHASSLSFVHPGKKKQVEFFCPLPKELQDCLAGIDKQFLKKIMVN